MVDINQKLSSRAVSQEDVVEALNREIIPVVEKIRIVLSGLALRFPTGTGSPEGVVEASPGSLYQRTDGAPGTLIYRKDSGTGSTGWTAVL